VGDGSKKYILQVVKFFGFCSLNYLRLDWPPDFRTDMQTTVLVRLYLFAVGEGRPSRTNRPRDLRNILLVYSMAKTIRNMFNLVTETLKHVVKYLNIKGVERETKAL